MGHYAYAYREHDTADFRKFWSTTVPYRQDGCRGFVQVGPCNNSNCTKKSIADAMADKSLDYPDGCQVKYIDCGIVGWEVVRRVRKMVDELVPCGVTGYGTTKYKSERHVREVEEVKSYKSKPVRILKGGTLRAVHHYVFSYDARCYDPYEHSGEGMRDEWSE